MMETSQNLFLTICSFIIFLLILGSEGAREQQKGWQRKLFVFGDSYADTGNTNISDSPSWKFPYGITFPGKPSGRFSDGRVSTDFIARYLRLKSPIPYRWRKYAPQNSMYGMNFAFGGSGVFETRVNYPNMTTQIDFFQTLIDDKMFNSWDLQNSVTLVSLSGNDYSTYLAKGGTVQGLQEFIQKVVKQLEVNLERIYKLGAKKIVVASLQPLGCVPGLTIPTQFQQCNETYNQGVVYHNLLLQQVVSKLNNQTTTNANGSSFIILDLYNAFMPILQPQESQQGNLKFKSPLTPCCFGINANYSCGDVDEKGNKMYNLCQDPKSSFFWDTYHPTQAGWSAIFSNLQANLKQLDNN